MPARAGRVRPPGPVRGHAHARARGVTCAGAQPAGGLQRAEGTVGRRDQWNQRRSEADDGGGGEVMGLW